MAHASVAFAPEPVRLQAREAIMLATQPGRAAIESEELDLVLALYDEGKLLQAHELAQKFGPLQTWTGSAALVMGGRLANNLGAPRLGTGLHTRAWHEDRQDPRACYYFAYSLLGRRGPLRALKFVRECGVLPGAPDEVRSDWYALHSRIYGLFRDFDAAEAWLERAEEACPDQPWTCVERSGLLAAEDRYDEALEAARRALALRPWFRPGVQAVADALQTLGRDREALSLLAEASERLENAPVVAQLAVLQAELFLFDEASRSLDRFVALAPLLEKEGKQWLAARRADLAAERGDLAKAVEFSRECAVPFYLRMADRMAAADPQAKQVRLPVGFVRQHHQTCAPATLAAISGFWGRPVDHLKIAEEICYDGTPDHRGRNWVERNGWVAREFSVTRDAAERLLDRGIPFTLTTVDPWNGHLQAVIGYDARRGTLRIRDPSQPYEAEADCEALIERMGAWGPRGMALVPADRAELLDGLDLPDATLYDQLHQISRALWDHRRDVAASLAEEMERTAPGHRLTLNARRVLATYDSDTRALLASVDGLLELYPEDTILQLSRLAALRDLARRDERLQSLRALARKKGADPAFTKMLARELSGDAREVSLAWRSIRWVLRLRPLEAEALAIQARLHEAARRFADAMELYRFALCLDDKDESLARYYFLAARHLRRTAEALELLRQRFDRFGDKSGLPARTLSHALNLCDRTTEAAAVLNEALQRRPDDGELAIFAAETHASHGHFADAEELLARAEARSPRSAWLQAKAFVASCRGEPKAALELWSQVVEAEPLSLEAHHALARLLAATEGRSAVLIHLRAVCDRFPHHQALGQLLVEWTREEGPVHLEAAVRRHLELHPDDAWGIRELGLALAAQGRPEEALKAIEQARALEPNTTVFYTVLGQVLARAGKRDEMRAALREAIRLSVDNDFAVSRLMESCVNRAERRGELAFLKEELIRQVITGDGLIAYQNHARGVLEPQELLASLQEALEARPDLWHAWAAVIRQLVETGQHAEAGQLAARATERFPHLARVWIDRAFVCRAIDDQAGEIESLREALRITPSWSHASRQLSFALERAGRLEEAKDVLEAAAANDPLDGETHAWLADILWKLGKRELALERMALGLRLETQIEWAWPTLQQWSFELGRNDFPVELLREITDRRPADTRGWILLARFLRGAEHLEERLHALERAARLDPLDAEANDLKASLLTEAGRYDEAIQACRPAAWGELPPHILRGREAWIAAMRGDVETAIEAMRRVVAEEPDYFWGWYQLAGWYRDQDRVRDFLAAAEELVRIGPGQAEPLARRGEAHLVLAEKDAARRDFEAAVKIDPSHAFAGLSLFDLCLNGHDLTSARRVLETLQEHQDGPYVIAREVQLAARVRDEAAATAALERLCALDPSVEAEWPFVAADKAMQSAGWQAAAATVYGRALDREGTHLRIGPLWIERTFEWIDFGRHRRLARLLARGEIGRLTMRAYLDVLLRAGHRSRIRQAVRRHRDQLRADPQLWGYVGYVLLTLKTFRAVTKWMSDWSTRENAEPWMLANLALSLRALGRDAEAAAVSRKAVELPPDQATAQHQLWLAFGEALDGDDIAAAVILETLRPYDHDPTNVVLRHLVVALLEARRARDGEAEASFAEARRLIAALSKVKPITPADRRATVRAYRTALKRIAREQGNWSARTWRLWRSWFPTFRTASG